MNSDDPHPVLLTARLAVLLIFFMPSNHANRTQWIALASMADSIQAQLGDLVRVLCIDEAAHPDVVQTFAITQTPTFVLLRRGVELWRQQGLAAEATLVGLIREALAGDAVKNELST